MMITMSMRTPLTRIRLLVLLTLLGGMLTTLRAADVDDLAQITRTNAQAPGRPAAQQALVTATGKDCEMLFLGDSNTHFWENGDAKKIWDYYYTVRKAINFGIGGDTINDIRARLRDTTWGDCRPAVTVVLAGTNDRGDTPARRAKKIRLLLDEVLIHFPQTTVLLLSIPPCGLDEHEALTTSFFATNDIIKTYADDKRICYIDLAHTMTWEEGLGFSGLGGDRLHLDELGRLRWAELMEPTIAKTLHETALPPLPHPSLPDYIGDPHTPKILIAGDGIAFMGDFRYAVQYQLRDQGFKYHFVGPFADKRIPADAQGCYFAAWESGLGIIQKIVPPITSKYAPDILLLFAGFGEVNYGKNQTAAIAPPVSKIIDDIHARAPGTQIILALITPHAAPEKNATILAANKLLLDMLRTRAAAGDPIPYIDCYSAMDNTMLSQGYLPTKVGLQRAARLTAPTIEAVLNHYLRQGTLPAPTNLTLVKGEAGNQLSWQAVANATGYNIKRAFTPGGPYTLIGPGTTGSSFTDAITRADTDYYYVVSAMDTGGQGKDSAEVNTIAGAAR